MGGDLDKDCSGRWFVDLTGSPSGSAKVNLIATPGRRPRSRWDLVAFWCRADSRLVDHEWFAFGQCGARPGCYAGATAPEKVVCVVVFGRLESCGRQVVTSVRFWPCFSHKQEIVPFVWFLDPVSAINLVISSIYSDGGYGQI